MKREHLTDNLTANIGDDGALELDEHGSKLCVLPSEAIGPLRRYLVPCVYELVDVSNDEMYMPISIELTLEDACKACVGDEPPCEEQDHDCELLTVEVRKREIGVDAPGAKVATFRWERRWDDDDDDRAWRKFDQEIKQKEGAK